MVKPNESGIITGIICILLLELVWIAFGQTLEHEFLDRLGCRGTLGTRKSGGRNESVNLSGSSGKRDDILCRVSGSDDLAYKLGGGVSISGEQLKLGPGTLGVSFSLGSLCGFLRLAR